MANSTQFGVRRREGRTAPRSRMHHNEAPKEKEKHTHTRKRSATADDAMIVSARATRCGVVSLGWVFGCCALC